MSEDLAWAAGLFEGEGSVRITKPQARNWGTLVVAVTNTDTDIIAFFQDRWPAYCKQVSGTGVGRRRVAYVWTTAALKAASFLVEIQPHLRSDRMKERVAWGLDFQATVRASSSEEYREDRWTRHWWMAELNLRGLRT